MVAATTAWWRSSIPWVPTSITPGKPSSGRPRATRTGTGELCTAREVVLPRRMPAMRECGASSQSHRSGGRRSRRPSRAPCWANVRGPGPRVRRARQQHSSPRKSIADGGRRSAPHDQPRRPAREHSRPRRSDAADGKPRPRSPACLGRTRRGGPSAEEVTDAHPVDPHAGQAAGKETANGSEEV